MGLDVHALIALTSVRSNLSNDGVLLGDVATLGRQKMYLSGFEIKKLGGNPWSGPWIREYADELLIQEFGASSVSSFDFSPYEGATDLADFNDTGSLGLHPRFDSILDFGTSEHVANPHALFSSIDRALKPGGVVIHVNPSNCFNGHGLYQFSPELFTQLYSKENGFESVVFISTTSSPWRWLLAKDDPTRTERISIPTTQPTVVVAVARKRKSGVTSSLHSFSQKDYLHAWQDNVQRTSPNAGEPRNVPIVRWRRYLGFMPGVAWLLRTSRSISFLITSFTRARRDNLQNISQVEVKVKEALRRALME